MPDHPVLVLILGASFSGTTALGLMLGAADDSFSVGEAYTMYRPWRPMHYMFRCGCGRDPCPVWSKIHGLPARRFHAGAAERLGVRHVVDSSKNLAWALDAAGWGMATGMRVAALVTWKEPGALGYSCWKRTGDPMFWRGRVMSYYARLLETRFPFRTVAHADLVADAGGTVRAACEAVGIAYRPGMERYWEAEHHIGRGNPGVRRRLREGTGVPPPEVAAYAWEDLWRELDYDIERDPEVRQIRDRVLSRDLRGGAGTAMLSAPPPRILRPGWHYRDRIKRFYWRFRPRRW